MVHAVALPSSSVSLGVAASPAIIEALDNGIRDQLQRASHEFFVGVLISAFVVAVGVVLEGPEILHELWPSLFTWFTWTSNERLHKFERVIKKIAFFGWLLIGIGVFGEGVFEGLQNRAEGQLQTFNDILLKDARLTASTAKQSALDAADASTRAKAKADDVERRADALDVRMNNASGLLGGIEQAVSGQGPRWRLLQAKKSIFIDVIKGFKGQKYSIEHCGPWVPIGPVEQHDLENTLRQLLDDAGWVEGQPLYLETKEGCSTPWGTNVYFTAKGAVLDAGDAVTEAFTKVGIMTIPVAIAPKYLNFLPADPTNTRLSTDPSIIVFVIGTNPLLGVDDEQRKRIKEMIERNKQLK